MRGRFIHQAVLAILLICQFSVCLGKEAPDANNSSKYLDAVREFADNVLKYGRDTYGPKHTPLFVDGLNIHTHEPVHWITPDSQKWVLSNLASQQNLFRTFDGLSNVTGDPKYRKAAEDAIKYALENLQSPSGLFYWGGHSAYDAQADKPCGRGTHELKGFYPYYELMWEVNPKATRQFIEAFWAGHILDWSSLSMNRHYYEMSEPLKRSWDYEYDPAPVFEGGGFSPSSTAGDLYYAGAWLSKFTAEKKPLAWAKRLAYRYVETRHPNTGISARVFTVFSGTEVLSNDEVLSKLKPVPYTFPWQGHANRVLWQSHFGYDTPSPGTMMNRVTAPWICQLMLGELLGRDGKEFIKWSLEELTAWGKVVYRKEDNTFVPMCYDGTVVEGYVCKEDSPLGLKGSKLEAVPVKITELWAYTLAYCLTKDAFMWEMARNIALANDCGDLGTTVDDQPKLNFQTALSDPYAMVVFLELHRRVGKDAFLKMAQRIGDNILAHRLYNGFVSPDGQYTFTKFDAIDPLALLHLHTALIRDKSMSVPTVWPGTSFLEEAYRNKNAVDDNQLIYALKGVSEPPRSLQEAAAEGDVEVAKSMIARGADVDRREDSFYRTALHRAAMSGHKDVAKLLIDNGARLDAKDGWPGGTALHYAAEKGQKEVVELLLASGADVDSIGGSRNETPLHFASRNGQKAIVEVLVAAGADVNAVRQDGHTPLYSAAQGGHKDVMALLITHGADINAQQDGSERTLLHRAAIEGQKEMLQLLLTHGADVNAKDRGGRTPLFLALRRGRKEVLQLLLTHGADVNARNKWDRTPLDIAVDRGHTEIVKLLRKHDAKADLWVLPLKIEGIAPSNMMKHYLLRQAQGEFEKWKGEYEHRKTAQQIAEYQGHLREKFVEAIGGLPERTPLNARVTKVVQREGYQVEMVVFESQPKHFVTGALFLPDSEHFQPPYPGVLALVGHSFAAKLRDLYQTMGALLALNGIASLVFDPIDQGERGQLLSEWPTLSGSIGHTMIGVGSILLGRNTARFEIWDGMRAIDYLQSRLDIDPNRIGCSGVSGGGTQTAYLVALDDRVKAAAPACYVTNFERLISTIGPQDAEQNIYGQLAFGMDHTDYMMMRAPTPVLICTATDDFFDILGTWTSFRYAKRLYSRLGFAERIDLMEYDGKHSYDRPTREVTTHWMKRWLRNKDEPVSEPPIVLLSEQQIQCTPKGQVMLLPGARSAYDLNRDFEKELANHRKKLWATTIRMELFDRIRQLCGIRELTELPEPTVENVGVIARPGYNIRKVILKPEQGVYLPALMFVPDQKSDKGAVLYTHEDGKGADAGIGGPIEKLVNGGKVVLAVDLRGIGETQSVGQIDANLNPYFGPDLKDFFTAYLLGRSYVGMRTEDVLICARFLQEEYETPVTMVAVGHVSIPALHAAAIEPDIFCSVKLVRPLISWSNVIELGQSRNQLINVVHGALTVYDLPDLAGTLEAHLAIEQPLNASGEPIEE